MVLKSMLGQLHVLAPGNSFIECSDHIHPTFRLVDMAGALNATIAKMTSKVTLYMLDSILYYY